MADSKAIQRRLKEERIPEAFWPEEWGEKKKRPREVAVVDVNLCFPCLKCPEFCPVGCIEQLPPGTVPGRGEQPVQIRVDECIGCYICVEVCALLTDYDAIRMYDTSLVEQALGVTIGDAKPAERMRPEAWEEDFAEGGGYRHVGHGSRIAKQMAAEERARMGFKTPRDD